MASFRFPPLSQRSQSCHPSPNRDSDDQSPSSLSPRGDTGTHGPAPPMTPFQTPYPLEPGPWRPMASCLQKPAAPPPPAPVSLPKLSKIPASFFLWSWTASLLGFLPQPSPNPEHQALWSLGPRNPGPQPLPPQGPAPDQLRTSQSSPNPARMCLRRLLYSSESGAQALRTLPSRPQRSLTLGSKN